jgi:hypothetical protein
MEVTSKIEKPGPPLATKFSDQGNTHAEIDGKNKQWRRGYDLKPGKHRTLETFDPRYTPAASCVGDSSHLSHPRHPIPKSSTRR